MTYYDTIIIGGGAAAYSAAIYASRYNMKTIVISKEFGGESATAGLIENYPGFPEGIDGFELMQNMKKQAEKNGVEFVDGLASLVKNVHHCFQIDVGKKHFEGKTIILCVGTEQRTLGLKREQDLKGKGLHYCATCDGPLYKGKRVAIVGGGDSAVKWANQMSPIAGEVVIIAREDSLDRAEPINLARLDERKNVTRIIENEVTAFVGEDRISGITLKHPHDGSHDLPVDAVFVAIGAIPRSEIPKDLDVNLDERGQVMVDKMMKTSVDGVFAAGDITDGAGSFKQIVTAAAEGALAATSAYHDTLEHPNVCSLHAVPVVATETEMTTGS
jgi:thioredoxin reductase (NADPH)